MRNTQRDIEERAKLAGSNKFELLLFRLGASARTGGTELYGINVFKVREVLTMPPITALAQSHEHLLGVANIRGQIIPVVDLPAVVGCKPAKGNTILMVTEYARTVQAFAVEGVNEIVRLDWEQVLPAEESHGGALITGIARIDGADPNTRLAQVLDVEQILRATVPAKDEDISREVVGAPVVLPHNACVVVADDSSVARTVIELGLKAMGVQFVMTKSGKEAWERLLEFHQQARDEGRPLTDLVSLVLTDVEMPEMDGFTLTRKIKETVAFAGVPVVIHSSLTGVTNEEHIRAVGADGFVGKFAPRELAATLRKVLSLSPH